MTTTNRLTTNEVAQRLSCEQAAALQLLKAAGVPFTRMGRRGPCLWDASGVEKLIAVLPAGQREPERAGAA
jgi:hypothetical protein